MKIKEIAKALNGEILTGKEFSEKEIFFVGASDLMSDVLAYAKPNSLLLTGLTTQQVIYTCEMAQISSIVFVRGKVPSEEVLNLAKEKKFVIIATKLPLYEACGILYKLGLPGTYIEPLKDNKKRRNA